MNPVCNSNLLTDLYNFQQVARYQFEPFSLSQFFHFPKNRTIFLKNEQISLELINQLSNLEFITRTLEIKLHQPNYSSGLITKPKLIKGLYFTKSNFDTGDEKFSISSFRRLLREINEIFTIQQHSSLYVQQNSLVNLSTYSGVLLFPFKEDASKTSIYNGDVYIVDITISKDYPFRPPKLVFLNTMYHPNITKTGWVRISKLRNEFSPALMIMDLVKDSYEKLMNPEPDALPESQRNMPESSSLEVL